MIEERLLELIRAALETAAGELGFEGRLPEPELTPTKKKEHGDFATNVALVLASTAGTNPRQVAEAIRSAFPEAPFVERVEVAGPGFLNIFVTDGWLYDALRDVVAKGTSYGAGEPLGKRVQVEFVSANPTGPLHVGHARNAVLGDAIARLLEHAGWSVEREYYYNDAGGQMDRFGASVEARYLTRCGIETPIPEDGYHGSYIDALALELQEQVGSAYVDMPPRGTAPAGQAGGRRAGAAVDRPVARTVRGGVRHVHVRGVARGEARDRAGDRTAARDGAHLRGGRRGVVPLHHVRRRQGSCRDPLERDAHVLRRGHRLRGRQVLTRVRPSDLRLGRRPPRRRRSREGRRPSARPRPRRRRDRALSVGGVPPRRRAGPHEQAGRDLHLARSADRRGGDGRRALHAAAVLQ